MELAYLQFQLHFPKANEAQVKHVSSGLDNLSGACRQARGIDRKPDESVRVE